MDAGRSRQEVYAGWWRQEEEQEDGEMSRCRGMETGGGAGRWRQQVRWDGEPGRDGRR